MSHRGVDRLNIQINSRHTHTQQSRKCWSDDWNESFVINDLFEELGKFTNQTWSDFSTFKPASESEISKMLFNRPNKQCDSDPIPTWLLKECSALLVPTTINIVNLSLSSGNFHQSQRICHITSPQETYLGQRSISNLSLISKVIERVVKSRLSDHLTSNNLVNPHQSAY